MSTFAEKSGIEGLKWPEEASAAPAGMEGMEGEMAPMMEGEAAEGGEGEMAPMEGEMMAASMAKLTADAFGEVTGLANLPKLLLSLMFLHPVFGDAVKAATMTFDLGGDKGVANFGAIAAIVGSYVNAEEKAAEAAVDSWGAAWCTSDDMDEIKEVLSKNTVEALVFPGVCGGWANETDALAELDDKRDGKTKVLFKFNGKVAKPAGDTLHVFARQFAKVESFTEPAEGKDYWVCTLSDWTTHIYENMEAFNKAVAAIGTVVADAAEAVMEPKMMEGDMMMAEGEGMAPMEGE